MAIIKPSALVSSITGSMQGSTMQVHNGVNVLRQKPRPLLRAPTPIAQANSDLARLYLRYRSLYAYWLQYASSSVGYQSIDINFVDNVLVAWGRQDILTRCNMQQRYAFVQTGAAMSLMAGASTIPSYDVLPLPLVRDFTALNVSPNKGVILQFQSNFLADSRVIMVISRTASHPAQSRKNSYAFVNDMVRDSTTRFHAEIPEGTFDQVAGIGQYFWARFQVVRYGTDVLYPAASPWKLLEF